MKNQEVFMILFKEVLEENLRSNKDQVLEIINDFFKNNRKDDLILVNNDYHETSSGLLNYNVINFKSSVLNDLSVLLTGQIELFFLDEYEVLQRYNINQTVITYHNGSTWNVLFSSIAPLTFTDIEKKVIENYEDSFNKITYRLFSDGLTDVLNREGFESLSNQLLREYDPKCITALFILDIDDFKLVNDTYGHPIGDEALKKVAVTLKNMFRNSDAVGRMGGDEFMVMLVGSFNPNLIEKKASELLTSVKIEVDGKEIPISLSVGVAYGKSHVTFDKLYHTADKALYRSKKNGKNCYHMISVDTNFEQISFENVNEEGTSKLNRSGKAQVEGRSPYEALIGNMPGSVLVFSLTDRIRVTHANDWTQRYTGFTKEELSEIENDDITSFAHPDDRDKLKKIIQNMYDGLDEVHAVFRARRKDGTYGHVQIDASMTERTQKEIIFLGIETDVEELYQLKLENEKAHDELKNLLDAIPGGVLTIEFSEEQVKLEYQNRWISKFLGYSENELSLLDKQSPYFLVHPEDRDAITQLLERMKQGNDATLLDYRLLSKSGQYKKVRIRTTLSENIRDKKIHYGVISDINSIKS